MTTISDVAKRAGVSIKTVSRVLNNEPHVRPRLRDKVIDAARALDYRPNQAARQLAGSRSFLLAFLYDCTLINPSPDYAAGVQSGAALRCRERGYHLVVEPIDTSIAGIDDILQRLVGALHPDGIILTPPLSDWLPILRAAEVARVPIARIAAGLEGYGRRILIDEREVSSTLVTHLIEAGHRRIGIIKPHPDHLAAQARFIGYCEALTAAGLPWDPALAAEGLFDPESGYHAAQVLLSRTDPPTAIFAANDAMALAAMQAARDMGLHLPSDLAVAGFDDSLAGRTSWPSLTTVRQPIEAMGRVAVDLLIDGCPPKEPLPNHQLIVRASTAPR